MLLDVDGSHFEVHPLPSFILCSPTYFIVAWRSTSAVESLFPFSRILYCGCFRP
jgi:hypothetical protein